MVHWHEKDHPMRVDMCKLLNMPPPGGKGAGDKSELARVWCQQEMVWLINNNQPRPRGPRHKALRQARMGNGTVSEENCVTKITWVTQLHVIRLAKNMKRLTDIIQHFFTLTVTTVPFALLDLLFPRKSRALLVSLFFLLRFFSPSTTKVKLK